MSKASFSVRIHLPKERKYIRLLGVTSIYPNLNGFLFCTEDGDNFQIEHYRLSDGMLTGLCFEYDITEEDVEAEFKEAQKREHRYQIIDGREDAYHDWSDLC